MNKGQVKIRIFLLQMLDWLMFIAITAAGIYLLLNSDRPAMVGLAVLAGLLLVSKVGDYTKQKIARLNVDMDIASKRTRKQ